MQKILIVFLVVCVTLNVNAAHKSVAGRYLYVVTCDAQVKKIDTVTQRQLPSVNLADRTGKHELIPKSAGVIDGCLASSVVFDPATSIFHMVAPMQARLKLEGTNDYNVLSFSVPALHLVKHISAGDNLAVAPHLNKVMKVIEDSEWAPSRDIDLTGFTPEKVPLPNQIIETSGDKTLLRMFTNNSTDLVLAVADLKNKTLVSLKDAPPTVAPNVHLTPGGSMVLVEIVQDRVKKPVKNGKLALFNASSGLQVREYTDPRVKEMRFVAISPNGNAIYLNKGAYVFLNLGETFENIQAAHMLSGGYPELFFSDK